MQAIKNFSPALVVKSRRRCCSAALLGPRARTEFEHGGPGASIQGPRPPTQGASLFPAKREAKREATKAWQAWPGNQTSSRCLVRSLVSAAGGYSGPGFEIRVPLETKWYPTRKSSGPILPFLEVFWAQINEEREGWGSGCGPKPPRRGGTSLFPAKREAKREATKAWQAWPGNQTSSRCLVRSLVSAAGGYSGPGFEIRVPLETKWYPTRKSSGPILPFLEVFWAQINEEREGWGSGCGPKPPRVVAR